MSKTVTVKLTKDELESILSWHYAATIEYESDYDDLLVAKLTDIKDSIDD